MMLRIIAFCFVLLLAGCAATVSNQLTVRPGERVVYYCGDGSGIVATYYSLSDNSLDFVKVQLPEGAVVTLPRALSASGVRYTDDREWVWWTKGNSAFAETRTSNGEWQIRYPDCRQTAEKR